ncbi:MAG: hypothetical protein JXX28_18205 [Deltaproteobacteria bacterium]|nr:hypothetical protein [Deltaproteobacteria bacterium]
MSYLVATRDWVRLVGVCQAWDELGTLSDAGRLSWARGFFELRLMDRAWIRLRELADRDDADADTLLLAGELLVARGWGRRAGPYLDRLESLEPAHQALPSLRARSDEGGPEVDASPERPLQDVEGWLLVVESHMVAGSFIKAESLLDRVARQAPQHPRVRELRAAVTGELSLSQPLWEVVESCSPLLHELEEFSDEPEHTESVDAWEMPQGLAAEEPPAAFPSLFREEEGAHVEESTAPDRPEITQTTSLSSLSDLAPAESTPVTVAALDESDRGDTRILRVIHRDGTVDAFDPDGPSHEGILTDPSFDLDAYRREMGMEPLPGSDMEDLEDEDEGLIVLTRTQREEDPVASGSFFTLELDHTDEEVTLGVPEASADPEPPTAPSDPPQGPVRTVPSELIRENVWIWALLVMLALLVGLSVAGLALWSWLG